MEVFIEPRAPARLATEQSFVRHNSMAEFFDWWVELPRWLRGGLALTVLAVTGYFYTQGVVWPWGWGIGGLLLLVSFPAPMKPRPRRRRPD